MKHQVGTLTLNVAALVQQGAGQRTHPRIVGQVGRGRHQVGEHKFEYLVTGDMSTPKQSTRQPAAEKSRSTRDKHLHGEQVTIVVGPCLSASQLEEVLFMRKSILSQPAADASSTSGREWLDLQDLASAEISSEDAQHPFENALQGGKGGWRAAVPGPQVIRLNFDHPQAIRRIRVEFREAQRERSQEFAIFATSGTDQRKEVVRQQWSFSPGGSAAEVEDYTVDLPAVVSLELKIDPGRHDHQAIATLESILIA